MTEVSNALIYDVVKAVQARLRSMEDGQRELRGETRALRGNLLAVQIPMGQVGIANISETIGALDTRLSCIKRRLDIIDTPAP